MNMKLIERAINLELIVACVLLSVALACSKSGSDSHRSKEDPEVPAVPGLAPEVKPVAEPQEPPEAPAPKAQIEAAPEITSELREVAQANTKFAFEFYAELAKQREGNLLFSPAGVSMTLAMVYAGARGETEKEIGEALRLSQPKKDAEKGYSAWLELVGAKSSDSYEIEMANRLWGQKGTAFVPSFVQLLQDTYAAPLGVVDFVGAPVKASEQINAWAAEKTRGKITKIVSPESFGPLIKLILTNAVYFKGDWAQPFDERSTEDAAFYPQGGTQIKVPTMKLERVWLPGARLDSLSILELAYKGRDMAMYFLLPVKRRGLKALERRLSQKALSKWTKAIKSQKAKVYLPKFKYENDIRMNDILQTLGMKSAFESRADFTGIDSTGQLYLSAAEQVAQIEVNEKGAQASAVTHVRLATRRVRGQRPPRFFIFRADHPFLFVLMDKRTDGILFIGRVVRP